MRAIYLKEDFSSLNAIKVEGARAHHLNVIRLKMNEEVLILNGEGSAAIAIPIQMSKKEIIFEIKKVEGFQRLHQLSLAIALPKKEAFEDILKMATELGVNHIYPVTSKFSQFKYEASERFDRIIESALIQSNNFYWPIIHEQQTIEDFLKNCTDEIIYFSSKALEKTDDKNNRLLGSFQKTILVGPEGGFSDEEDKLIASNTRAKSIHLLTPILRAPTAVAASIGYILSSLE